MPYRADGYRQIELQGSSLFTSSADSKTRTTSLDSIIDNPCIFVHGAWYVNFQFGGLNIEREARHDVTGLQSSWRAHRVDQCDRVAVYAITMYTIRILTSSTADSAEIINIYTLPCTSSGLIITSAMFNVNRRWHRFACVRITKTKEGTMNPPWYCTSGTSIRMQYVISCK